MILRILLVACALVGSASAVTAQDGGDDLKKDSDAYLRDELGVNDITAPSIAKVLNDLGQFRPIPLEVIATNKRDASFDNRLQTSLHFGALVADGFMLTLAERSQDVDDVGRALLRQAKALGVSDSLTKRSKSLFELSDKGDWQGMRDELVRTQADVEKAMLDLHDEEMAHMISLGGWLRGFQLAATSCAQNYSPEKAKILARPDIMDYYLDRLDTLHPRLKKTELVATLIAKLTDLRTLASAADGRAPTEEEVKKMREVADDIEIITMSSIDAEGHIFRKSQPL